METRANHLWVGAVTLVLLAAFALAGAMGIVQGASFAAIPQLNHSAEDRARASGAVAQLGNLGTTTGTPLLSALDEATKREVHDLVCAHVTRPEGGCVCAPLTLNGRTTALVQGSRDRLRPILMTMGTAILGMVPIALSTTQMAGSGPPYYPMARAIAGGLAFSTLVSLLFLPTIYAILDDMSLAVSRRIAQARRKSPLGGAVVSG